MLVEDLSGYLLTLLSIAQLITVGKRAAQWAQDLMFDLENIEHVRNELKFRGMFIKFTSQGYVHF